MADVILLTFASVFTSFMIISVLVIARRALGDRPVGIELVPANTAKCASEVDLGPNVDTVNKQFAETLDSENDEW
jgi:hypothetical protein